MNLLEVCALLFPVYGMQLWSLRELYRLRGDLERLRGGRLSRNHKKGRRTRGPTAD